MNMNNKIKIPAMNKSRVYYFLAILFVGVGYALMREKEVGIVFIDIGIILALIVLIMYPLSCAP